MSKKIVVLLFSFIGLLQYCNTTEPPPPDENPTLTLTLEDASSIEAWIKLTTTNLQLPDTVKLKQNNIIRSTINLMGTDTLLYIDSLLPGTNYSYVAETEEVISETLEVTTMDTTSHNFTWQTFTFGEHSSSVLFDVAIIDENNIWAVGKIFLYDSLGQPDPHAYNVVHWDGIEWKPEKINVLFRGNIITPTIEGVFAFSDTDIWFVASLPIHGDGTNWTMYDLRTTVDPNLSLSKAWGSNSNDMYFVGRAGSIAHYSGPTGGWHKIESGTELPLTDIYSRNEVDVYISGAFTPEIKGILLRGNANQFSVMINSEIISENELFDKLYGELATVWIDELGTIYTGGNLLFRYKNNEWNYVTSLPENYIGGNPGAFYRGFISSIRGNASNDYIIAGDRNTLQHFNGLSWAQIGLPYSPSSPIIWYSIEQKGITAIAVGDKGSKAFIILLTK